MKCTFPKPYGSPALAGSYGSDGHFSGQKVGQQQQYWGVIIIQANLYYFFSPCKASGAT
jgi:hypothetical protein